MFHLKEKNTTARREFIAGLTTFAAMAYILMVNAAMFCDIPGSPVTYGAMYVSTAVATVIGCLLTGFIAGVPLAQAPAMGINAFFVYSLCCGMGFSYANALMFTLLDGIVFVILTVTGLRRLVFEAVPKCVKTAISAGIGLFIAFIGFQNIGFVVDSPSTLVDLHSFNLAGGSVTWSALMPILVFLMTVIVIGALSHKKVRGALFFGMLIGTAAYYALGYLTVSGFSAGFTASSPIQPIKEFFTQCVGKVFTEGLDFSAYIAQNGAAGFIFTLVTATLALCMVDMFDTMGTLYGTAAVGNMLDENGDVPRMEQAMLADAIATCAGAVCGNSTVSTFVESASGIAEGGKTGLTSVSTALLFFIAIFFAPIASLIPTCATAAALVYVGILMMGCVSDIDWSSPLSALPAFITIAVMPFTYNISYGIAFGLLSYILICLFTGKVKEIKPGTWVIGMLFTVMFFVSR